MCREVGEGTSDDLCTQNSEFLSPSTLLGTLNPQHESSKWKVMKYSRPERRKRKRECSLIDSENEQSLITTFFPLVSQIDRIISEQPDHVGRCFLHMKNDLEITNSKALELLMKAADKNKNKSQGKRYDEKIKLFSKYLYLTGGCLLYETLYSNLKESLPSISTVRKDLNNDFDIQEGNIRFEELKNYLVKRNYPLRVWISEDATAITGMNSVMSLFFSITHFG